MTVGFGRLENSFSLAKREQPYRLGDVVEIEGEFVYVIAIESIEFRLVGERKVRVSYIVQSSDVDVSKLDGTRVVSGYSGDVMKGIRGFVSWDRLLSMSSYDSGSLLSSLAPGKMSVVGDVLYRIREYSDIRVTDQGLVVVVLAEEVLPVRSRDVSEKFRDARREYIGIRLVD